MALLKINKIREHGYKIEECVDFTIKKYLSFSEKKLLINNILDMCVIEEDIKKIDFALKEFAYEYMLINEYTSVDFEIEVEASDILSIYDELKEHGVIDKIIKLIPESEKEFIDYILRKEIEQIQLVDNSMVNIVNQALNKLVDKIPDQKGLIKLIKELPKQFNKVSPDSLKNLGKAMGLNLGEDKNA